MNNLIMAVCDADRQYCIRLSEYLRSHLELSFNIQAFTEVSQLRSFTDEQVVSLLVSSDSFFDEFAKETLESDRIKNVLVLEQTNSVGIKENEDEHFGATVHRMSKYVPASEVARKVLDICSMSAEDFEGLGMRGQESECRVIGFYTPISRSGQTTMAIRMGEKLSEMGKTLLLSFESFSSITGQFETDTGENIIDLMYYADCDRDKFCIYLEKMRLSKNGLDYIIPPVTSGEIRQINAIRLKELMKLLSEKGGYKYIILDLKDYPEDFGEILSMCDVVYTIGRNNSRDHYRIASYNKVLSQNGYDSVLASTIKVNLPDARDVNAYNSCIDSKLKEGMEVLTLGA